MQSSIKLSPNVGGSCAPAALLFGLLVTLQVSCTDISIERPETAIVLTVKSTVDVNRIRFRLRTRDASQTDEIIAHTSDRDLTAESYLLVLRPSRVFDGEFFVFAQGFQANEVNAVTAESMLLTFESDVEVSADLYLREGYNDRDDDGFERCTDGPFCDCDDEKGRGALSNPYLNEQCGDAYDNDCDGVVNEGCACVEDVPCTELLPQLWDFAGLGACSLGVLRCVDGHYALECEGAGAPINEIASNFVDDDCDGHVDEGSPCAPGAQRACFLGVVDDAAHPVASLRTQATDLALGECNTGVQVCTSAATWGACEGETRPQRDLYEETQSDGAVVLREGVGWREVLYPAHGWDQCDGLDNDCDGSYDEEPYFDVDGDSYTYCGTCTDTQEPRLCDIAIDCDDTDILISPAAQELCGNIVDEDCVCDHGDSIGQPVAGIDGSSSCTASESYLNCGVLPRSDSNPTGSCFAGEQPWYFGYVGEVSSERDCYGCGLEFGEACDSQTLACQTKAASCAACAVEGSLAEARPLCTRPGTGCSNTDPPVWVPIVGEDPNNECGTVSCAGYYWGQEADRCYARKDQNANEVNCDGRERCQDADDLCPFETDRDPEILTADHVCKKILGGCEGKNPPVWGDQANNEDLFDECRDAFPCDGSGGGDAYYFGLVDPAPNNGFDSRLCYYRANVQSSFCNGNHQCQTHVEACTTAPRGDQVLGALARPLCKRPVESSSGVSTPCSGTTPPTYELVTFGADPYQECGVRGCCSKGGGGVCCTSLGEACTVNSECSTGRCHQDWAGGGRYCAADATTCVYSESGVVHQRVNGYVECSGGDSWRQCLQGAWASLVPCPAVTCDNQCGYITNADNACVSGVSTSVAGCEAVVSLGEVTCVDCGDYNATPSGCNAGLGACDTGCAAACEQGETSPTGVNYCASQEGDSMEYRYTCQVAGGRCGFHDDSDLANDILNEACTAQHIDCSPSTGECLASCQNDSECNGGYHCESGPCVEDLSAGAICDENSDCVSGRCRDLWGGGGKRCAASLESCVITSGTVTLHRQDGYVECNGGDSYRVCNKGVWMSSVSCPATTCDGGCGYISNIDNHCVSGTTTSSGGCSAEVNPGAATCVDCGGRTSVNGGCNTTVDSCNTATCDATCVQGTSTLAGTYCKEGNSWKKKNGCAVSNGVCAYVEDGDDYDELNQNCGNYACVAGACETSCVSDSFCVDGYHCDLTVCVQDLSPGEECDEDSDCASGHCRQDWDGVGRYCATDSATCVIKSGDDVSQRGTGFYECGGSDGYKLCTNGVWSTSPADCNGATCRSGCGYVSDTHNRCVSGFFPAGCVADYGVPIDGGNGDFECVDCGGRTAVDGGCASTVDSCAMACGAICIKDESELAGTYCKGGDSWNKKNGCAVTSQACGYVEDGDLYDQVNEDCGNYSCESGACLVACQNDADCAPLAHCEPGGCTLDLVAGEVCDENSDCLSSHCRAVWGGAGERCADSAESCVVVLNGAGLQRANGYVECNEDDSYRVCNMGVWESPVSCPATKCNNDCGYIKDEDNACISGPTTAVGGCEALVSTADVTCVDCGGLSSVDGGCATTVDSCSIACSAACLEDDTALAGSYCSGGSSWSRVDICGVSGGVCGYVDDGAVNDTESQDCGAYACDAGACKASCVDDDDCESGKTCNGSNECI